METGLYVVATPIGNFGDMSQRAVEVLQQADLIAAEDTRHSQRLLQFFAIDTPAIAYHDHSDERAVNRIDGCLERGGTVALVSDAGTPLISDPGYRLVRHVQDRGFPVRPIPGACAAIAALCVSGLPTDRFLFEGFLPAREGAGLIDPELGETVERAGGDDVGVGPAAARRVGDARQEDGHVVLLLGGELVTAGRAGAGLVAHDAREASIHQVEEAVMIAVGTAQRAGRRLVAASAHAGEINFQAVPGGIGGSPHERIVIVVGHVGRVGRRAQNQSL